MKTTASFPACCRLQCMEDMDWFKFYGGEFLSDPKMIALSPCERSCWLALLSFASVVEDSGRIKYLTEEQLLLSAGLNPDTIEWKNTKGVLKRFVETDMITHDNGVITITHWQKRQGTSLTNYERVKRYREKKRNDNAMITGDNENDNDRREEKRREYKTRLASKRGVVKLTTNSKDMRRLKDENEHYEEKSIDADTEEITVDSLESPKKGRDPVAVRVSQYFFKRAEEYTGKKFVNTGYSQVKRFVNKASEEDLKSVVDDYFDSAPTDTNASNIYKCINATSVNKFIAEK